MIPRAPARLSLWHFHWRSGADQSGGSGGSWSHVMWSWTTSTKRLWITGGNRCWKSGSHWHWHGTFPGVIHMQLKSYQMLSASFRCLCSPTCCNWLSLYVMIWSLYIYICVCVYIILYIYSMHVRFYASSLLEMTLRRWSRLCRAVWRPYLRPSWKQLWSWREARLRGGWAGVRLGRIPEACSHNNPSCLCFWYRSAAVDECSWTVSIHVARISLKAFQKFNPDSGRVGPHHRSRSGWGSWGYSTIVAFRFLVAAWPWLIPYAMRNECWNIWNRYPFHVCSWCKAMSRALEALQSEWLSVVKRTFIHLPIPSSIWSGPSSGQKTASTLQAAEINKITMIMCEEQGKGLLADFLGFWFWITLFWLQSSGWQNESLDSAAQSA